MLFRKKYKLLPGQNVKLPDGTFTVLHRIVALKDISEHGVKKNDVGGYVSGYNSLSQKNSCWIADNAIVISTGFSKKEISINARTLISEEAYVQDSLIDPPDIYRPQAISISGRVSIIESDISGSLVAKGNVRIVESDIIGNNVLDGDVRLNRATLKGVNLISGNTNLPVGFYGRDISIQSQDELQNVLDLKHAKKLVDTEFQHIKDLELAKKLIEVKNGHLHQLSSKVKSYRSAIKGTLAEYESYTSDIVKLLKYPMMADGSIPEIRDLIIAVRKARRELATESSPEMMQEIAFELESAFIIAETKALTTATTHLDDKSKASLTLASQLLTTAADSGATHPERKAGFKAGMKSLEGIIHISDEAITRFKSEAGLLAIEA